MRKYNLHQVRWLASSLFKHRLALHYKSTTYWEGLFLYMHVNDTKIGLLQERQQTLLAIWFSPNLQTERLIQRGLASNHYQLFLKPIEYWSQLSTIQLCCC